VTRRNRWKVSNRFLEKNGNILTTGDHRPSTEAEHLPEWGAPIGLLYPANRKKTGKSVAAPKKED